MKIIDIIRANAEFVRNSGFSIHVQSSMDMVTIKHESNDEVMDTVLIGDEGYQFIAEALKQFDDIQDISLEEIHLHLAKPYMENM
ncbi:hypothetical protein LMH73_018615 [Vibrio splendidus]|nr:hypothetical protein [Vibrio splendidus]MCC4882748.1 hypothetical protein [Vibrio splendidus]